MAFKYYQHFTDSQLKNKIKESIDCNSFDNHCEEVAKQLGISKKVVRSVLMNYSFYVLKTLQNRIINQKTIKINIFGYFSFRTLNNIIFKFIKK